MEWLFIIVIIIMAAGLIGTWLVGQSASNREENPRYFHNTGKKWLRLSAIYILGIAAVVILYMAVNP